MLHRDSLPSGQSGGIGRRSHVQAFNVLVSRPSRLVGGGCKRAPMRVVREAAALGSGAERRLLREPPRRISRAGAALRKSQLRSSGWEGKRGSGAGDAPWSGREAPARSAPFRHPANGSGHSGSLGQLFSAANVGPPASSFQKQGNAGADTHEAAGCTGGWRAEGSLRFTRGGTPAARTRFRSPSAAVAPESSLARLRHPSWGRRLQERVQC
jgi:hypothetical protein